MKTIFSKTKNNYWDFYTQPRWSGRNQTKYVKTRDKVYETIVFKILNIRMVIIRDRTDKWTVIAPAYCLESAPGPEPGEKEPRQSWENSLKEMQQRAQGGRGSWTSWDWILGRRRLHRERTPKIRGSASGTQLSADKHVHVRNYSLGKTTGNSARKQCLVPSRGQE